MSNSRFIPFVVGICLSLMTVGTSFAASFKVGDRVFIPLYSENLLDDGYADGIIQRINADGTVNIKLSDVVNGEDKIMYGTCSPSGASEQIMTAPTARAKEVVQDVPTDKILPWTIGQFQYVERENLSTTLQRWLGSGMAITPNSLDIADRRARELDLPRLRVVIAIAKLQVESTGGNGFPVPASRALHGAAKMLDDVAALVQSHPNAVSDAAAILAKTAPPHSKDLLVEAIVHIAKLTQKQLAQLASDYPDPMKVEGYTPAQLIAIYAGYYRMMTANDTQPYENAKVAYFSDKVAQAILSGHWPKW
ncbi:hypothetical protein [Halothiobacillus sp.]|uniref:hypothetical protein n=1 Tax=Halothiobacillus sp. TaxID=1891311 RepID=UPI003D1435C1